MTGQTDHIAKSKSVSLSGELWKLVEMRCQKAHKDRSEYVRGLVVKDLSEAGLLDLHKDEQKFLNAVREAREAGVDVEGLIGDEEAKAEYDWSGTI